MGIGDWVNPFQKMTEEQIKYLDELGDIEEEFRASA